jgi:hypothetical protein
MENNMIQLANTVAQISVELKSMKNVENVMNCLKIDIQELQKLNLNNNKQCELLRSTSEPRKINFDINKFDENDIYGYKCENKINIIENNTRNSKENTKLPTYTNPRKLKKLTKYLLLLIILLKSVILKFKLIKVFWT